MPRLETDDALHRGHVIEAPAAEIILEVDQLFGELIELPEMLGIAIDREPRGADAGVCRIRLRNITAQHGQVDRKAAAVEQPQRHIVKARARGARYRAARTRPCRARESAARRRSCCRPGIRSSDTARIAARRTGRARREIAVYSLGVMVRSTSQAELSCSRMRDTRDSVLNAGCRSSAAIRRQVAVSSWIASFIQSSEVWCWMMNSVSSCAVESKDCASRILSSWR